jgi:hypothetical protein
MFACLVLGPFERAGEVGVIYVWHGEDKEPGMAKSKGLCCGIWPVA